MNKAEMVASIAEKSGLGKAAAAAALEAFVSIVEAELVDGRDVRMVGFGTFSVNARAARDGRNPATGESIKIAAKNVVKFKPSANLSRAVNE